MDDTRTKVASILRTARACEAGEVPCPFCHWGPDDDGKPHEETGCFWYADQILNALTPDGLHSISGLHLIRREDMGTPTVIDTGKPVRFIVGTKK